ncbi:MAG: hypothetical protein ACOC6S_01455 [Chloroflexota bacterium]
MTRSELVIAGGIHALMGKRWGLAFAYAFWMKFKEDRSNSPAT